MIDRPLGLITDHFTARTQLRQRHRVHADIGADFNAHARFMRQQRAEQVDLDGAPVAQLFDISADIVAFDQQERAPAALFEEGFHRLRFRIPGKARRLTYQADNSRLHSAAAGRHNLHLRSGDAPGCYLAGVLGNKCQTPPMPSPVAVLSLSRTKV